jgi:hypothetical protein
MNRKPPSQGMCLLMSQMYWEELKNEQLSWDYLFCWGMYEMYVEGWSK